MEKPASGSAKGLNANLDPRAAAGLRGGDELERIEEGRDIAGARGGVGLGPDHLEVEDHIRTHQDGAAERDDGHPALPRDLEDEIAAGMARQRDRLLRNHLAGFFARVVRISRKNSASFPSGIGDGVDDPRGHVERSCRWLAITVMFSTGPAGPALGLLLLDGLAGHGHREPRRRGEGRPRRLAAARRLEQDRQGQECHCHRRDPPRRMRTPFRSRWHPRHHRRRRANVEGGPGSSGRTAEGPSIESTRGSVRRNEDRVIIARNHRPSIGEASSQRFSGVDRG